MESLDHGETGLFGSFGAIFFILLNVVSLVLLVKFWMMTNDVREMKTLLKDLLDQKGNTPIPERNKGNTNKKTEPLDPGWASDVTETEMEQAKSLLHKLYKNEVIIKDLSSGQPVVWDQKSWNAEKSNTGKYKLLYTK